VLLEAAHAAGNRDALRVAMRWVDDHGLERFVAAAGLDRRP